MGDRNVSRTRERGLRQVGAGGVSFTLNWEVSTQVPTLLYLPMVVHAIFTMDYFMVKDYPDYVEVSEHSLEFM